MFPYLSVNGTLLVSKYVVNMLSDPHDGLLQFGGLLLLLLHHEYSLAIEQFHWQNTYFDMPTLFLKESN